MKLSEILSSKYWIILPTILLVFLNSFIMIVIVFGPMDTIAVNHVDIHVVDVQPACVNVTTFNTGFNKYKVRISCPELLQDSNRQSIEEDMVYDLYNQAYVFEQDGTLGWGLGGSEFFSTFIPHFSATWSIEKNIDNTPIVLSGTARADPLYIVTAILFRIAVMSVFGFLFFSFFGLPYILYRHNQHKVVQCDERANRNMKLSSILSSKYWAILPVSFAVSLFSLIGIMLTFGALDTITEEHLAVRITEVYPSCVEVTLLSQKNNDFEVNIACPEILQHPNRESIEEEIAEDLHSEGYEIPQYRNLGWIKGSKILSTVFPDFFNNWRIEKNIDTIPIVLVGRAQADAVYIAAAMLMRIIPLALYSFVAYLFVGFLTRIFSRKKT